MTTQAIIAIAVLLLGGMAFAWLVSAGGSRG